jgi:hypothetical protein
MKTIDLVSGDKQIIVGDDKSLKASITKLGAAQIEMAWFTVKKSVNKLDAEAVIQKLITTMAGTDGAILDAGTNGTAVLEFLLYRDDTLLLKPAAEYIYDIQILTTSQKLDTPIGGILIPGAQVTRAEL